ncbi:MULTISPECIES: hypothetical protein [unclassified Bacillus (in: firmicutes)]|uniref:hypothetical protein n=1 Tax=unclassified Bacillus (in: firmicutes) TaxID=185979 RepID=UPI001BEA5D57|nr:MULTISPECIES: hypothetical protein [unclassified Bacillus (in: firmicutes)]MBT2614912.1 hypothetical protein [Bacillus sp. ISL-78]MBT2627529.1 hypothetical protein [Bacillus sp. ISL-101]MBT2717098.1 hypothetical protein [Bacillus sp. ISL-57]
MGSMESIFFTDIFGKAGKGIPTLLAIPLLYLIRDHFKEIKDLDFGMMLFLSIALLTGLAVIFVV